MNEINIWRKRIHKQLGIKTKARMVPLIRATVNRRFRPGHSAKGNYSNSFGPAPGFFIVYWVQDIAHMSLAVHFIYLIWKTPEVPKSYKVALNGDLEKKSCCRHWDSNSQTSNPRLLVAVILSLWYFCFSPNWTHSNSQYPGGPCSGCQKATQAWTSAFPGPVYPVE